MTCGMNADDAGQCLSSLQRYLILAAVVLGSSLYSTALLTTSTILPQMQGALSATQDEIAWAMTFNILATAVVTPMTGWLVARFGAKRVMTLGILSFSIATFGCGLAQSLDVLVVWRIIQGGTGAPVVPLSQTILLNTFPRRQHQMVLGLFGTAVAVYVFIFHCLTTTSPFLNLKLLTDRNYAIGLVLVTIYGMLNFTPMVLLPPLLQQQAGYPDALVGQVIGARGVGMTFGFMMAGLMSRIDPRIGMAAGFGLQTVA